MSKDKSVDQKFLDIRFVRVHEQDRQFIWTNLGSIHFSILLVKNSIVFDDEGPYLTLWSEHCLIRYYDFFIISQQWISISQHHFEWLIISILNC